MIGHFFRMEGRLRVVRLGDGVDSYEQRQHIEQLVVVTENLGMSPDPVAAVPARQVRPGPGYADPQWPVGVPDVAGRQVQDLPGDGHAAGRAGDVPGDGAAHVPSWPPQSAAELLA